MFSIHARISLYDVGYVNVYMFMWTFILSVCLCLYVCAYVCVYLLVRVHSDVWVFVFGIHSYIYDIVCLAVSNREVVRQH